MNSDGAPRERRQLRLVAVLGVLAVIVWLGLVLRFWHPLYGFTRFLQLDAGAESCAVSELHAQPVFVYRDTGGYDGQYYAQLAFHPDLSSPELPDAIDNLRYRARRILGSALAWAAALGDPQRIPHVYAALNLVVWLVLAGVLWRLLPVRDLRSAGAWFAVMFSSGALGSVRFALTDLLALLGLALAWRSVESDRPRRGVAALAIAALARETALAGIVGWWNDLRSAPRTWWRPARFTVAAIVPLAAWIAYICVVTNSGNHGVHNFAWPLAGWGRRGGEFWTQLTHTGSATPTAAGITALLAFLGLTAQALWFLTHPQPRDRIWRLGAVYTLLFVFLSYVVWEGEPGAATRVLLPLTLAFALVAVRQRLSWIWLLAGLLPVAAGFESLRVVPHDTRELAAGRIEGDGYVLQTGGDFYSAERNPHDCWAWSAGHGTVSIRRKSNAAPFPAPVFLEFELRTLQPGTSRVRLGETVLWQAATSPAWQSVQIALPPGAKSGDLTIETDTPAVAESAAPNSRRLALAVRRAGLRSNVTRR